MSRRCAEIDIARGIGIILAVLGHALKMGASAGDFEMTLTTIIYSFHMPLFFLISGFLSAKIINFNSGDEIGYIKGRGVRLLLPYLTVSIIYIPLKLFLSQYAIKEYTISDSWRILVGESPNTTLWFLYSLFVCSCIGATMLRRNNIYIMLFVSLVIGLLSIIYGINYRPLMYFFYFVLGIVVKINYKEIKDNIVGATCTATLLVVFIASCFVNITKNVNLNYPIAALSGSGIIWVISVLISEMEIEGGKERGVFSMLGMLGRHSMDIYILSDPVMTITRILIVNILHLASWISIVSSLLSGVLLSLVISKKIIRRSNKLSLLFLGELYASNI